MLARRRGKAFARELRQVLRELEKPGSVYDPITQTVSVPSLSEIENEKE